MQTFARNIAIAVDNTLNPLLLRELRQLVRNRFIIVLINLFIALLVFCCMMIVMFQETVELRGAGETLFRWLSGIMSTTCFIAVVIYTATTTANERINGDLMYASAMRPSSIIFGKLWAGVLLTFLLMSITAPFVMLAYLLRGLDIEMVAQSLLSTFIFIQVLNGLAVALFCNVKTKAQMSLMLFLGLFLAFFMAGSLPMLFMRGTFRSSFASTWTDLGWFYLAEAAVLAVLLVASVASISPPTSNRLLPVRLVLTAIYLGSLVVSLFLSYRYGTAISPWVSGWLGSLILLPLLVVCERETWTFRIRQAIPRNFLLRCFIFPFYTGSPCGLVWIALLASGVFAVSQSFGETMDVFGDPMPIVLGVLLSVDYCVTALLLRSWFAPRNMTPDKTWIIVLIMLFVFTLGAVLIFFLFHASSAVYGDFYDAYADSWLSALNPTPLADGEFTNIQTRTIFYWACGLTPFALFWFVCKIRHFSPFGSDNAMTFEQAVQAVRQADANPLVKGKRNSSEHGK